MITLKEISHENWRECIQLKLKKEQEHFLPSNLYSLVQASYQKTELYSFVPLGVYNDNTMVGFIMWDEIPNKGTYVIPRVMIDAKYQGNGYAKQAMKEVIKTITDQKPNCKRIEVSYKSENVIAERLYASLGFEKNERRSKPGGSVVQYKVERL
jgi:diamine N-acetyltransferase